ncbi:hypothetical protein IG631_00149 [Alternaria alternata]|nr:hypothetical protein IG631_00149 [Alternaria alternata]
MPGDQRYQRCVRNRARLLGQPQGVILTKAGSGDIRKEILQKPRELLMQWVDPKDS